MALSGEQQAKLEQARRDLDAAEQRIEGMRGEELRSLATAAKYAAFDVSLKAAQLEFQRLTWVVHLLEKGQDCEWRA